jgi:hypothetical protein
MNPTTPTCSETTVGLTLILEPAQLERILRAYEADRHVVTKYANGFNQWLLDTIGEWVAEVERELVNQTQPPNHDII